MLKRERFPAVTESVEELERLLRAERDAQVRRRIHLLLLIRSGQVRTRTQAARHLAVHRNSIYTWLQVYKSGGLESLLRIQQGSPKAEQKTLSESVFEALLMRLAKGGFPGGYLQVQRWLKDEFELEIPYKTVHGIIYYRLKAKLKRARPSHQKKTRSTSPPSLVG
jgi:transposase